MALAPLASHTSAAAMRFPSLCKDALAGADHPGGSDREQEEEGDKHENRLLADAIGEVPGGDRTDDRPDKGGKKELEGVALGGAELVDGEAREVREDTAGAEPEDRGGEHVLRKLALGEQTAHVAADVD